MADQDFDKPLRTRDDGKAAARRLPRFDGVVALACAVAAALAVAGAWALFVHDPLGGEPIATAAIERRAPARPAGENAAPVHEPAKAAEAERETSRDGVPIVNPGEPMPKVGPVIIRVPGAEDAPSGKSAPSSPSAPPGEVRTAMLEDSRYGALPRIAADGARPLDAYARPQAAVRGPRVALVVSGLGIGRDLTAEALKALPAEVTLAFSPYGPDVAEQVAAARKDGHETLIQAPMEPFAYPSNDPGPQTLLTSLPASANLERLRWSLGRASGYVGVAPLAGGRFLQSDDALAPIFTELARRGLMFVAQGQAESRFSVLAEQSGLPALRTAAPIDATPDGQAIDAALADLAQDAKQSGSAIGLSGVSPLALKRIEAWRAGLAAQGVALVPLTSVLKPQGAVMSPNGARALPLRRCVGVALFNAKGLVFVGRRRMQGAEPDSAPHRWQMPQGGIDGGEDPLAAAKRELHEETGVRSVELLAEAPKWFDYAFPPEILARTRNGKYSGQTQMWFAFRFLGDDSEVNLAPGHKPEFDAWRWAPLAETPGLIVPFKRSVYQDVVKAFSRFAG